MTARFDEMLEVASEPWAMEPDRLAALAERLAAAKTVVVPASAAVPRAASRDGAVVTIPVTGVLMRKVPAFMSLFGVEATDLGELRAAVDAAANDPAVERIVLAIDSPGGQASGVFEVGEAILRARQVKPVDAIVGSLAASGAYWLASQASAVMAGPDAYVGAIGVYQVWVDSSKAAEQDGMAVHVVRSGAHKGMGVPGSPITEEQLAAMQKLVDGMAELFTGSVAVGRGRPLSQVRDLATGQLWIAAEAKRLGLIDRVETASVASRRATEEAAMAERDSAERSAAAAQAAVTAERERAKALRAAFPDDPQFAAEQFEAGATLEQAALAYLPVARRKIEAAGRAQAHRPTAGAEPVEHGGEASQASPDARETPFLAAARAYCAERKIDRLTVGLRHVARTQPALFTQHKDACRRFAARPVSASATLGRVE